MISAKASSNRCVKSHRTQKMAAGSVFGGSPMKSANVFTSACMHCNHSSLISPLQRVPCLQHDHAHLLKSYNSVPHTPEEGINFRKTSCRETPTAGQLLLATAHAYQGHMPARIISSITSSLPQGSLCIKPGAAPCRTHLDGRCQLLHARALGLCPLNELGEHPCKLLLLSC